MYAAIVMSFARCISAISAGDLNMRQPAVTGSALTKSSAGASFLDAVEDEEANALFDADAAGARRRDRSGSARQPVRALVLLPGPHVVAELDQLARARFLERRADPGELAFAGMTATNGRSLSPQRTPVK